MYALYSADRSLYNGTDPGGCAGEQARGSIQPDPIAYDDSVASAAQTYAEELASGAETSPCDYTVIYMGQNGPNSPGWPTAPAAYGGHRCLTGHEAADDCTCGWKNGSCPSSGGGEPCLNVFYGELVPGSVWRHAPVQMGSPGFPGSPKSMGIGHVELPDHSHWRGFFRKMM